MKWLCGLLLLTLAALGCSRADTTAANVPDGDKKGVQVDFDGLMSRAPAEWQKEESAGALRFMQFKLPKAKDDKADAEVVIFKGIGGSAKQNIDRWKTMFRAPEGKTVADVSTTSESKVGKAPVTTLDIHGTYMFNPRPFDPNSKAEPRKDYRMIGVVFEGDKNVYHIRLVGPTATVEHYRAGFEQWVKNFK